MPLLEHDRAEILQLGSRYAHAIDSLQAEAWADCFTEDGSFESDAQGRFQGRDEMIGFVNRARTLSDSRLRHWTTHWVIDGDGETATTTSYGMLVNASTARIIVCGVYHDQLKKIEGNWKFVERRWVTDGPAETAAAIAKAWANA